MSWLKEGRAELPGRGWTPFLTSNKQLLNDKASVKGSWHRELPRVRRAIFKLGPSAAVGLHGSECRKAVSGCAPR
jgi:hypothetical protein